MSNIVYKAMSAADRGVLQNRAQLLAQAFKGNPVGGVGPNGYRPGTDIDGCVVDLMHVMDAGGYTPNGVQEPLKAQHLYFISASIWDYSLQDGIALQDYALRTAGITGVSVNTTWCDAGDESADYIDKLPDALADAAGKEDVVFLIHGFGNDISRYGPWPGGRAAYEDNMRAITKSIQDAGHKVIWADVSYRLPGFSNPSAPYNENVQKPVAQEVAPGSVRPDGVFFLDMYSTMYDIRDYGFRSDGIHPNDRGNSYIRGRMAIAIRDLLRPELGGVCRPADVYGKTVLFQLGSSSPRDFTDGLNPFVPCHEAGSSASSTSGHGFCPTVRSTDGALLPGVWMDCRYSNTNQVGASGGSNNRDVTDSRVVGSSVFVHPDDAPGVLTVYGLPDGVTGRIRLSAARDTTSTDRVGAVTHKNLTQNLSGDWQEGEDVSVVEFPFTVEDGVLQVSWVCAQGSTYAYLNAEALVFDQQAV